MPYHPHRRCRSGISSHAARAPLIPASAASSRRNGHTAALRVPALQYHPAL